MRRQSLAVLITAAATSASSAEVPFTLETVDSLDGNLLIETSVEFDSKGTLHVLYMHPGTGELRHAVKRADTWIVDVVETSATSASWSDLAIGPGDQLHAVYRKNGLSYATLENGV